VTVVTDTDQSHVVHASDGRKKESLAARYDSLTAERPEAIESAGMDIWPAKINATTGRIPDTAEKIAFDRFHVVRALIDAVDKVRRRKHGSLLQQGDTSLTRTRYAWQTSLGKMNDRQKRSAPGVARQQPTDGSRMGDEGMRDRAMGLCEPEVGNEAVEEMVRRGDLESVSQVAKMVNEASVGDRQRDRSQGRQRPCGECRRQDPKSGLPQRGPVQDRDPFPPRRVWSPP